MLEGNVEVGVESIHSQPSSRGEDVSDRGASSTWSLETSTPTVAVSIALSSPSSKLGASAKASTTPLFPVEGYGETTSLEEGSVTSATRKAGSSTCVLDKDEQPISKAGDDVVTAVLLLLSPLSEDACLVLKIGRAADPDEEVSIGLTKPARKFSGKKTVNSSELFKGKA